MKARRKERDGEDKTRCEFLDELSFRFFLSNDRRKDGAKKLEEG